MSQVHGHASAITEHFLRMAILFLVPLLVSFLVYLVATSAGAAVLPTVGYGLVGAQTANGVSYLWCMNVCGSHDPSLPTTVLNIMNALIILGSVLLGFFAVLPMMKELAAGAESRGRTS